MNIEKLMEHHTKGGTMIRITNGAKEYVLSETQMQDVKKQLEESQSSVSTQSATIKLLETQLAEAKEDYNRLNEQFSKLREGKSLAMSFEEYQALVNEKIKLKEALEAWKELASHLQTIYQEDSRLNQVYTHRLEALAQEKGEQK